MVTKSKLICFSSGKWWFGDFIFYHGSRVVNAWHRHPPTYPHLRGIHFARGPITCFPNLNLSGVSQFIFSSHAYRKSERNKILNKSGLLPVKIVHLGWGGQLGNVLRSSACRTQVHTNPQKNIQNTADGWYNHPASLRFWIWSELTKGALESQERSTSAPLYLLTLLLLPSLPGSAAEKLWMQALLLLQPLISSIWSALLAPRRTGSYRFSMLALVRSQMFCRASCCLTLWKQYTADWISFTKEVVFFFSSWGGRELGTLHSVGRGKKSEGGTMLRKKNGFLFLFAQLHIFIFILCCPIISLKLLRTLISFLHQGRLMGTEWDNVTHWASTAQIMNLVSPVLACYSNCYLRLTHGALPTMATERKYG